ncbi:uncharacterized protein CBL_09969 [Carabus blaptoides fortunei]
MFNQVAPDFLLPYLSEPDARISKWFLTNSYIYMIIAVLLYFLALKFGKQFMKNREPYQLKNVLLLYNSFQALFSLFIFLSVAISAYQLNYKLICQDKNFDIGAPGQRMVEGFWYFLLSKYIDMLDTLFFILRKKDNQLSFLHCYHHSITLITTYTLCVFYPGGHLFFGILANSFVHVIMYSYYFLAALGPAIQKYLWWKRYLTQLQLVRIYHIGTNHFVYW